MRLIWRSAITGFILLSASFGTSPARTWHITANGTGDAPTIQAGIDSATAGDSVVVAAGTYTWTNQGANSEYGMIHIIRGKNDFVLCSQSGPEVTILDAQRQGRVMFISGFNNMVLDGFTIRGGDAPAFGNHAGGGIAAHLTHDIVRNCIFTDNIAEQGGGLWSGGVSSMTIENCQFLNNQATFGGAMFFINSSQIPNVRDCSIVGNAASSDGGAIFAYNNGVNFENCVISSNAAGSEGGAFASISQWPCTFTSCTIVGNGAPAGAGFNLVTTPSVSLERCIVAYGGGPAFTIDGSSGMTVHCCDVYANTGGNGIPAGGDVGGNFSLDPLFCNQSAADYTLEGTSPCAQGNHPDGLACGLIGVYGVDCGDVPVHPVTWGAIKAQYR